MITVWGKPETPEDAMYTCSNTRENYWPELHHREFTIALMADGQTMRSCKACGASYVAFDDRNVGQFDPRGDRRNND